METLERNKDVILNFGLIAVGPLREIEKLQQMVIRDCKGLKIVYQTVSAKRLKLVKVPPAGSNPVLFLALKPRLGETLNEAGEKQA
jgi:hypothetical protein